jgi:hypothetical protein
MADDWDTIRNNDYLPPPIGPTDELTTVDTSYGPMEKWKAHALSIGWFQRQTQLARDDSADDQPMTTALGPEAQEPPALAADEVEHEARAQSLSDEDFAAIEKAVDTLDQRLSALEARRDAERKLSELEDALEATGIAPDEEGQPINLH